MGRKKDARAAAARAAAASPPAPSPVAVPAPPPVPDAGDVAISTLRRALDQIEGARLCFGEPVEMHGRTVVPVARVRASGGLGFGRGFGLRSGEDREGRGGGGGGNLEATPVGVLTIGPDGTRFEPIHDPEAPARAVKLVASGVATLITAVAGARALRRGVPGLPGARRRGVAGLLRRGG